MSVPSAAIPPQLPALLCHPLHPLSLMPSLPFTPLHQATLTRSGMRMWTTSGSRAPAVPLECIPGLNTSACAAVYMQQAAVVLVLVVLCTVV